MATVPRKNIYVREADQELWEKAEKLAGESLSAVVTEALRGYVARAEAKAAQGETGEAVIPLRVIEGTGSLLDLSSQELTVISDVLRRVDLDSQVGRVFGSLPEFATAIEKIEDAKTESYRRRFHTE